ncbi:MAG: tetratricopeptide repeat protein, partial [Longimicrobiales bacterium]|nr:tetratricopeptide repeat protein [Longimicrobiales bacterium]
MGQPQEVHIRKLQDLFWSEADPDGRSFVPLADALRKVGDFREAHRLLRDGLERHPDFLSGHVVAAWLSMDQGKPEEAESRFGTALELDPHNISALRGLAEILLDRGEVDSALGLLDSLLREDPVDLDLPDRILALMAQVDARTADVPDAEIEPERVVWNDRDAVAEELNWEVAVLQPDSSRDGASEGSAEVVPSVSVVEDGEPIPALEELDDALVTSTLGEIYLRQGLFDRAERVFQTLLERDPEN